MPVAERREALLAAATRLIARDGVRAASTRAIVAEAGMSLASFHYAFASHEEVIRRVLERVLRTEIDQMVLATSGDDAPAGVRDVVAAVVDSYARTVLADPAHEQAVLELHQYALRTPGLAEIAVAEYTAYHAAGVRILQHVAEVTGRRWSRPVEEIAPFAIALTDGLTNVLLTLGDGEEARSVRALAIESLLALLEPEEDAR